MLVQSKYGEKKVSPGGMVRLGGSGVLSHLGQKGKIPSTRFVGQCAGLKGYVFDYGDANHPELYCRSKEAMLNYIRVNYKEGDAVAESILNQGPIYPNKLVNPPAGASQTDKEIWK